MTNKRIKIRYKKERAVLADVLPYETPVTFTNRRFYDFLTNFKITYENVIKDKDKDGIVSWESDNTALDEIICLLFNIPKDSIRKKNIIRKGKNNKIAYIAYCDVPSAKKFLIPFSYEIKHKEKQYRELNIPHPRSQLRVVDFYEQYKETIIYYCSLSSFSIRAPHKVATTKFYNDSLHKKKLSNDSSAIEKHNKEYKNQRSFFSYKGYSNIHKFYESPHYHHCEKKYNKLLKLDITKCFDSIYTHSIAWAILGKMNTKESIPLAKKTFAGQFDGLMQSINHSETNGIIIGPELSRIFAEIILQAADKKIEQALEKKYDLKNKVHYEMLRYVDDYFIFYNEEQDKNKIVEESQQALKEYKLYFNTAKEDEYEKPLITKMSIAKGKISKLLEKKLIYKLEEIDKSKLKGAKLKDAENNKIYKGSIYVKTKNFITEFKTIIKECNVEYKDMLNYSFSTVERKCQTIMSNYDKAHPDHRSEEGLIKAIIGILEFVFFIYSVSPRVNTTIKLCRILRIFLSFFKENPNIENLESKNRVFKCIYDNIQLVLKKNKQDKTTQVETLYLLIALSELGREYLLEEDVLDEYFGIKEQGNNLNYFSLTVILYYMKNRVKYKKLRGKIKKVIIKRFKSEKATMEKSAEHTMLLLDMVSCPFIEERTKRTILGLYGINNRNQSSILAFHNAGKSKRMWFTTWEGFNFRKELDTKRSQEVY